MKLIKNYLFAGHNRNQKGETGSAMIANDEMQMAKTELDLYSL